MFSFLEVRENNKVIGRVGLTDLAQEIINRHPEEMSNIYCSNSSEELNMKFNSESIEEIEDYTTKVWCREILNKIELDENYVFKGSISLYHFEVQNNKTLISLAMEMLNTKVLDGYSSGTDTFEYYFEEKEDGLVCQIYMQEEYFDNEEESSYYENRYFSFYVYGSEMLPMNHFILQDSMINFISDLSEVVNRKYVFHKEGTPVLLVNKGDSKELSWVS